MRLRFLVPQGRPPGGTQGGRGGEGEISKGQNVLQKPLKTHAFLDFSGFEMSGPPPPPPPEAALELHSSSRTAEAALELYSRAHVKWLQLQAGRTSSGSTFQLQRQLSFCRGSARTTQQLSNCRGSARTYRRGAHTEVRLEGARVVWLQPLRTEGARGVRLICQMCV